MRPTLEIRLSELVTRAADTASPVERRALADAVLDLLVTDLLGDVPTERVPDTEVTITPVTTCPLFPPLQAHG